MSRSKHGHKHVGRAKCAVCRSTVGEGARKRELDAARADDRELGDVESAMVEDDLPEPCDGRGCAACSEDWRAEPLPEGVTVVPAHVCDEACADPPDEDRWIEPWDDHADCEQCTGHSPFDETLYLAPDGTDPEEDYVVVRGQAFGKLETPEPDAPCYGCRRGMRRAEIYDVEPGDPRWFSHVHLVREGVYFDCTGTTWKIEKILAEDDHCGDCGSAIDGGHACEGVPGGFGEDAVELDK